MGILQSASYNDFLSVAQNYKHDLFIDRKDTLLQRFAGHKTLDSKTAPVVFLTDLTRKKYVYMHKAALQLSGYKAQYWLDGGLDFYFDTMNKEDFNIYNKQIFPEYMRFLSRHPPDQYSNFVFSRNNRVVKADGTTANFLQRFIFIADPVTGSPVAVSGMVSDITHYRNDKSIIQTIEEINTGENFSENKLLFKKAYFPDKSFSELTKKETEVLKWMAEGFCSKQIAGKLSISIHTINNHRKNMLHKTNCNNTAELIHYGISRHII